jgi:hypothetical protein
VILAVSKKMSLFSATLLPGLFLIALGALLLASAGNSLLVTTLKAAPRSPYATALFWGGGALWFLCLVWNMSQADLVVFDSPKPLVLIFAVLALAAVYYVPDFLAVRGLCVIALVAAWQILTGTFGEYDAPQHLPVNILVYAAIVLAIYFACVPWRARDFLGWLFARAKRPRALGAAMLAYGALLAVLAFIY